ncbi:MAG: cupin domain-containing protein [Bacteroidetes bacterium]|nr:cupin domain-containing protein [Bacteroidota bacterium]
MNTESRAAYLIRHLHMQPHPEGGYYAEHYRSQLLVERQNEAPRSAVTSIYYLLQQNEVSRWHVVDADEIWHWHEGNELELWLVNPEITQLRVIRLGQPGADTQPSAVVPAGWFQAVRSTGSYSLCGCTVAPAFQFSGFRFTSPQEAEKLSQLHPDAAAFC